MSCNATTATLTVRLYIIGKVLKIVECTDRFSQAFPMVSEESFNLLPRANTDSVVLQLLSVI